MKRRQILATLGTAVFGSMAGCAGDPDRGSDESTLTDETTTSPQPPLKTEATCHGRLRTGRR